MRKKYIIPSVIFVIITLLVCLEVTTSFDTMTYHFILDTSPKILASLAQLVSFLASSTGLLTITFFLIFLLPTNKQRKYLVLNVIISALIIIVSKNIFVRQRPLLGQKLLPTSYSYPSGHSLATITYFGFLLYLSLKSKLSKNKKMLINIVLITLLLLIPISRMILGVHYISDVIAGVILGYLCLEILIKIYESDKEKSIEKPLYKTISYAIEGIITTIKEERNMTIHMLIMLLVITSGVIFHITYLEWIICFILCGLILALELVNTAIENTIDLVTLEKNEKAKKAKDTAAGAVLIMSIFASIIGLIIFLPKIFSS